MNPKPAPVARTTVRGKGWKKATTIATEKYSVIARAILSTLTTSPIAFSELVKRVEAKAAPFDGSVSWYTIGCLRELEVQGKVLKHAKPVRYSRKPTTKAGE